MLQNLRSTKVVKLFQLNTADANLRIGVWGDRIEGMDLGLNAEGEGGMRWCVKLGDGGEKQQERDCPKMHIVVSGEQRGRRETIPVDSLLRGV